MSWAIGLVGFTASGLTWLMLRALKASPHSAVADSIPAPWRVFWPWLSAWARLIAPHLTWRQRDVLRCWAQQAGLAPCVTPAHLCACGLSALLLGAVLGLWATGSSASRDARVYAMGFGAVLALVWLLSALHARVQRRVRLFERSLPFMLDLITLCVESGLSLHSALQQVIKHGPPGPLREELIHAHTDMRAGVPRRAALEAMAARCGSQAVRAWVSSMIQAEQLGLSLAVLLREQASLSRLQRVQRAEKLAMEAPVRMLLPLIGCIFPCTFIVLAFPIVMQIGSSL